MRESAERMAAALARPISARSMGTGDGDVELNAARARAFKPLIACWVRDQGVDAEANLEVGEPAYFDDALMGVEEAVRRFARSATARSFTETTPGARGVLRESRPGFRSAGWAAHAHGAYQN